MDAADGTTKCATCRKLLRQVARLETQVAKLTAALEEVRRGGKRQAAPFRKSNTPKPKPKKPGRKSGKLWWTACAP